MNNDDDDDDNNFIHFTFYAGIKIFNSLSHSLTILKNETTKVKALLIKHLNTHPFYLVDEFFICKD
jgi:hypothetical protein